MSILNSNNFLYKTVDGVKQFFSPLVNASTVVLEDGSRLEKDGRIYADQAVKAENAVNAANAENSAMLGGKAPIYYIQPRNLLDNSDFTNSVNQRGITYTDAIGYCIDRWRHEHTGNGGFNIDDRGAFLYNSEEGSADLIQIIDQPEQFTGKVMTFAVKYIHDDSDKGIYLEDTLIFNFTFGEYKVQEFMEGIQLIHFNGDRLYIRHNRTGWSGALKWAALYEGEYTAETLPPYVPKGYAVELAECHRYCRVYGKEQVSVISSAFGNYFYSDILLNPPMRIAPSLFGTGTMYITSPNYTGHTNNDTSMHIAKTDKVSLKSSVNSVPNGIVGVAGNQFEIILSADL